MPKKPRKHFCDYVGKLCYSTVRKSIEISSNYEKKALSLTRATLIETNLTKISQIVGLAVTGSRPPRLPDISCDFFVLDFVMIEVMLRKSTALQILNERSEKHLLY